MTTLTELASAFLPWGVIALMGWYFLCALYKQANLIKDLTEKIVQLQNPWVAQQIAAAQYQEQQMQANLHQQGTAQGFDEEELVG